MIQCTVCKELKSKDNFRNDNRKLNGKRSNCRSCELKSDTRYKVNPEKERNRTNLWRERNKDTLKSSYKKWALKKNYGLSIEEYNSLLKLQNNCCAICNKKEQKKMLAVDHCHSTGKVRGLLCSKCNTAIGLVKENKETLNKMIAYLNGAVPA